MLPQRVHRETRRHHQNNAQVDPIVLLSRDEGRGLGALRDGPYGEAFRVCVDEIPRPA
jgi:hypothetical protein